jgi:hypothetical protein
MKLETQVKEKEIKNYMIMLVLLNIVVALTNYRFIVRSYNTTMLALSYQYGFTSRSLLGTIYHLVDKILPIDMISYSCAKAFAEITTGLFFLYLMYFVYFCMKKCAMAYIKVCEYALLIFSVATVATFSYAYNFFRVDFCMIWMMLLALQCLMSEKYQWLAIPLSAIGVMFHQGFVFMYFNVILVVLFAKIIDKKSIKQAILFGVTLITGSALFLWFEFFSRSNGGLYFDTILEEAKRLSKDGIYHATLLYHEVLGIDLSSTEKVFVPVNHLQLCIFIIAFLPILVELIRFFVELIKSAPTIGEKLKYLAMAVGSATIVPNFVLKIDYGRWMMSVVAYYTLIVVMFLIMEDTLVQQQVTKTVLRFKGKPWLLIYLVMLIVIVPFMDVDISMFEQSLQKWIEEKGLSIF